MKIFLSVLGITAALVLCGVSAAMNFLFLSSLGKSPVESGVLGAASAAADLLKALLPFFIAWSWRDRRVIASGSGLLVWMFLSAFSLMSGIGFAADSRSVVASIRQHAAARVETLRTELAQTHDRMRALPAHRPVDSIREAIKGHKQNRRWQATKGCTDATETASRSFCEAYFAVQAELGAAKSAVELRDAAARLNAEIDKDDKQSIHGQDEPQAAILSKLSGLAAPRIELASTIAIALLVELGSSLGLFLASGHGRFLRPGTQVAAAKETTVVHAAQDGPVGSVEDFCLEGLKPSPASSLRIADAVDAYSEWCAANHRQALGSDIVKAELIAIFDQIGLKWVESTIIGIDAVFARGKK